MLAIAKFITFIVLAVVLAGTALLVPAHLKSLDKATVIYAGTTGATMVDQVELLIDSAEVGPARRLLEVSAESETSRRLFRAQISQLEEQRPTYRISGGPDAYFENFIELVQIQNPTKLESKGIVTLLLPRSERRSLTGLLEASSNANVAALLNARNIPGLLRLHPAGHPAGAPYDSGVLTLALLIESNHLNNRLAQQIGTIAVQARLRDSSAVRAIEDLAIATLSLGRILEYSSLASLAEITNTPTEWAQIGTLFRARPNQINTLYAALLFSESPARLFDYLTKHDQTGLEDVQFALSHGPEALQLLLESDRAFFRPSDGATHFFNKFERSRPEVFTTLSFDHPQLSLLLKSGLLFGAGLSFAFALGAVWRASFRSGDAPIKRYNPIILLRDGLLSMVIVVTVWSLFEPDLLKAEKDSVDNTPRIQFAVADTLQSLKTPVKAMQELNQVTLLVLALFFIIQLVIYTFCLIKLKEISKQKLSPIMKIRLLENEENLFDFGLYVGLGGTVLSLILVAVGVVEASLMAAYASTLFGILFTAVLKVMHIRPYRRGLIIESGTSGSRAAGLMDNIEL